MRATNTGPAHLNARPNLLSPGRSSRSRPYIPSPLKHVIARARTAPLSPPPSPPPSPSGFWRAGAPSPPSSPEPRASSPAPSPPPGLRSLSPPPLTPARRPRYTPLSPPLTPPDRRTRARTHADEDDALPTLTHFGAAESSPIPGALILTCARGSRQSQVHRLLFSSDAFGELPADMSGRSPAVRLHCVPIAAANEHLVQCLLLDGGAARPAFAPGDRGRLASALADGRLETAWPTRERLVITINGGPSGGEGKRFRNRAGELNASSPALDITEYLCDGDNTIKILQAGDMRQYLFVVAAGCSAPAVETRE